MCMLSGAIIAIFIHLLYALSSFFTRYRKVIHYYYYYYYCPPVLNEVPDIIYITVSWCVFQVACFYTTALLCWSHWCHVTVSVWCVFQVACFSTTALLCWSPWWPKWWALWKRLASNTWVTCPHITSGPGGWSVFWLRFVLRRCFSVVFSVPWLITPMSRVHSGQGKLEKSGKIKKTFSSHLKVLFTNCQGKSGNLKNSWVENLDARSLAAKEKKKNQQWIILTTKQARSI